MNYTVNYLSKTLLINCLIQDSKEEILVKILIDDQMTIEQFKFKV